MAWEKKINQSDHWLFCIIFMIIKPSSPPSPQKKRNQTNREIKLMQTKKNNQHTHTQTCFAILFLTGKGDEKINSDQLNQFRSICCRFVDVVFLFLISFKIYFFFGNFVQISGFCLRKLKIFFLSFFFAWNFHFI